MPLRYPNIEEFEFFFPNVVLSGGDVTLMGMPFNGTVAGFRAAVRTALDANNVDIGIQNAANAVLSSTLNIASADAAGTIFGAAGNGVPIPRGTILKLDEVENGAVASGNADIFLLLRKSEPGQIFDGIPRT